MATRDRGYVVAEFANSGGACVPLLPDEACIARGIESGRLPPRGTRKQAQRDAAVDAALERLAATPALAVVDAGHWTQEDTWCHSPAS